MEPGVSTTILLAVAISVSVGVAYWMGGVTTTYTNFEKVEVNGVSCEILTGPSGKYWKIELKMKNSGPKTAEINSVFLNSFPVTIISGVPPDGGVSSDISINGLRIRSGESVNLQICIDFDYGSLSSGTSIHLLLHSVAGMDYSKIVVLV